jgi:sigma-E factor negative regulatory protein RseB
MQPGKAMKDAGRMNHASKYHLFGVICLCVAFVLNASAESPQDWLERMVAANGKYSYQGTLVHLCDGKMDIVHIVHRVDGGQVTERMTAEAAGGRQIIRNADEVMCILPDQRIVTVERHDPAASPIGAQIANFPSFANISLSLYQVSMLAPDRVAERDTVTLAIRPVDAHRYGYRLWLDRQTALPLKFELMDDKGQGLEQGMFTQIEYQESITAQEVAPTIATDGYEWQRSSVTSGDNADRASGSAKGEPASARWRAADLPPGFELTFAQSQLAGETSDAMEQLVYSDGLATISVFIEPNVDESVAVEGVSRIAATNAFTTYRDGYLITAMGGVPLDTARMVALSVSVR